MPKLSTKALLGGAAIAVVAVFALAPSAQAACWWTGSAWNCASLPMVPQPDQNSYIYPPAAAPYPSALVPFPNHNIAYPGPRLN